MFISIALTTVIIICLFVGPVTLVIDEARGAIPTTYGEILPCLLAVSAFLVLIEGIIYLIWR